MLVYTVRSSFATHLPRRLLKNSGPSELQAIFPIIMDGNCGMWAV